MGAGGFCLSEGPAGVEGLHGRIGGILGYASQGLKIFELPYPPGLRAVRRCELVYCLHLVCGRTGYYGLLVGLACKICVYRT